MYTAISTRGAIAQKRTSQWAPFLTALSKRSTQLKNAAKAAAATEEATSALEEGLAAAAEASKEVKEVEETTPAS